MAVISSFTRSLGVLKQHPVLFAAAFLITLPGIIVNLIGSFSTIGLWLSYPLLYVALAFLMGGFYGMANEALDQVPAFDTFVSEGKDNFLRLLGGYLLFFVVLFVIGFVIFFVIGFVAGIMAVVLGAGGSMSGGSPEGFAGLGIVFLLLVAVLTLLAFLLFMVVGAVLQFFDVGIVVGGDGIVESFRNSFGIARRNPWSVAGYTLLRYGVMFLLLTPSYAVLFLSPGPLSGGLMSVGGQYLLYYTAALAVFGLFAAAVANTFHVAYYREITGSIEGCGSVTDSTEEGGHVDASPDAT